MPRSNKNAWLSGQGDLREEEVLVDYPVKGDTVLVRGLPARFSAEVQSQMKVQTEGREQIAKIDVAEMEALQFAHGVVEPAFTYEEAKQAQETMGPAYRKVIEVVDRLSGVSKEDVAKAQQRFPDREASSDDNGRTELGAAVADSPGVVG